MSEHLKEATRWLNQEPTTATTMANAANALLKALVEERNENRELRHRLEKIVTMLHPGKCPCECVSELGPRCCCGDQQKLYKVLEWWTNYGNRLKASAIAQGE